jgi:hypothetical protein
MKIFNLFKSSYKSYRKFSSCNYDSPILFGPMMSSIFFGGIYSYIILENVATSHIILKKELEDIRKELELNKKK